MKPPSENSGATLLDKIAVANLAAIESRAWSYGWRVGHLVKAIEPAIAAEDARLQKNNTDQRVFRYFSRKHRSQFLDTTAAAIVVLVHSFFDAAITELLVTCIMHNENQWRTRVIGEWKRTYSLEEALELDRTAIIERATDLYIKKIGNKSIINRYKLLLEVIGSTLTVANSEAAQHLEVIKKVDEARHRVVHNDGLMGPRYKTAISDAGELLVYAKELVTATAMALGLAESDVISQMVALGLEGVASPLLPEHLEGL